MALLVLIPKSAEENYKKLKETESWAFEAKKLNSINIDDHDKIFFFYGLRYDGKGKAPSGFPRLLSLENVSLEFFEIIYAKIISIKSNTPSVFGEAYTEKINSK